MTLVVDASMSVAWLIPDEHTVPTQQVLDRVVADGAYVPGVWTLEVGNALLLSERRGRMSAENRMRAIRHLVALPIVTDAETAAHAWHATWRVAEQFRLTLYDASYLELALRRVLPLATLDRDLRHAARALEIELLGA